MRFQTVQVQGHEVRYQVVGAGEPLILVHGLSASSLWWRRNVPHLAQHYRVYLIDLPGFGSMSRARRQFSLSRAATWLWEWIQAVGISHASFIGHSMGGYICLWLAAERSYAVERLVLVSPAILPQTRSFLSFTLPLLAGTRYLFPAFFPILMYDVLRTGPVTFFRATRELLAHDIHDKVQQVTVPTLLVWGQDDTLVPLTIGHILRQDMSHARLLVLPRAGHVSMFDRAPEFNDHVLAFLHGQDVGD